jgi:integrase
MRKSSRFWECFFDIDRDSWVCAKHPTIQRFLDYLCRKAGGQENASLQTRRNVLIALAKFCNHYNLSPEDACRLSSTQLSRLIQEFCDQWMIAKKIPTAHRHLTSLKVFFDKNGFRTGTDRELHVQGYGYHEGFGTVPSWSGPIPEYKPTLAECWRMANACGSTLEGLRDKAIILWLMCGPRNSDLRAFQYGKTYHFKGMSRSFAKQLEEWNRKDPIVMPITLELKELVPNACKWRRQHYKLVFPEAVEALFTYLKERERLYGPIGDNEPLFASHANNVPPEIWKKNPMAPSTLCRIVKVAARRAFQGDKNNPERWRGVHPHVFKKVFLQILEHGDQLTGVQILSRNDMDFLMGHKLHGSMEAYYNPKKVEELKEKFLRLGWTLRVHGATPIELRKRQLLDMMQFLNVPDDIQDRVKALIADWSKPEEFDQGIPIIRAILEGRHVKAGDLEANMPGYRLEVRESQAFIGSAEWLRTRTPSQKLIEIENLSTYLENGWRFISALPNGKCVIEKAR